jgi:hypothetical protein
MNRWKSLLQSVHLQVYVTVIALPIRQLLRQTCCAYILNKCLQGHAVQSYRLTVQGAWNFLNSWTIINVSRRTGLHGVSLRSMVMRQHKICADIYDTEWTYTGHTDMLLWRSCSKCNYSSDVTALDWRERQTHTTLLYVVEYLVLCDLPAE